MDFFNGETRADELLRLYELHEQFLAFDDDASSSQSRNDIPREYVAAEQRLLSDYFGDNPKYPERNFRRRYWMSRRLFLKIVKGIINYNVHPIPSHFLFFRSRSDACGRMSIHPIMKCMAVICQLAYGSAPDAFDEYLQIGERCCRDSLDNFTKCIWDLYSEEYLRKPTPDNITRLYEKHAEYHGFPGMLGSIDCMHWEWTNCPNGFKAQFQRGDHKHPTIMLEAIASQDLWIWHAFFGISGANNDLNVLYRSNLFDDLVDERAPEAPFTVNGHTYTKGYYLADGIYPTWATFVKSYKIARNAPDINFKRAQESARKDVERAFGVLQGHWGIIAQPARSYQVSRIRRIMYCCIILYNMILQDQEFQISEYHEIFVSPAANIQETWIERCDRHAKKRKEIRDKDVHNDLRHNLVDHLWERYQQQQEEDM